MLKILLLAASMYHVPPDIFIAMCEVESNLVPTAIHKQDGNGTSYGLCQIKLATARSVGFQGPPWKLMDPRVNAKYAARYFRYQMDRYHGNITAALTAYNAGHFINNTEYAARVYRHAAKYNITGITGSTK